MPIALLIDDLLNNSTMLELYLKRYGLDSVIVSSGLEGYEHAQQSPPDIIFTDIIMPTKGWNGYQTIRKFRDNPALKHIPIIAVSAAGDRREALTNGADDFLQRPYNFDQVEKVLTRLLSSLEN
ncbi:MAG: response regulator [Aggregatilineales bacterium]